MRVVRWIQPLPDGLATGASREHAAALHLDGTVWQLAPAPRPLYPLELPERVVRASVSARGELVAVATADGVAVWTAGRWRWLELPDFLLGVTDVRCAPDGASFGYGFRTGQPWSEDGSYGWPTSGVALCDPSGEVLWEDQDTWSAGLDDPQPKILAWEGPGRTVLYRIGNAPWLQVGRGEAFGTELSFEAVWATFSPDGDLLGLVSADGRGLLMAWNEAEPAPLQGQVLAIDLEEAPLVAVLRPDGRWEELVYDGS